jgi:TfoX N-terminal domain
MVVQALLSKHEHSVNREVNFPVQSEYVSCVSGLLLKARPRLTTTHNLEFKNCFGAVAGYVRTKIFISCGEFGIALKLPRETIERIVREDGGRHLKYFTNGHVKRDYVVLPKSVIEDNARFKTLLDASIQFVLR